jgi:hypothetical protein
VGNPVDAASPIHNDQDPPSVYACDAVEVLQGVEKEEKEEKQEGYYRHSNVVIAYKERS